MQLKIKNGSVDLSGTQILKEINFEINDNSRIAVVGRNGCGKTTLLKLIAGEYSLSNIGCPDVIAAVSGKPKIGYLSQITFQDDSLTMLEEIRKAYTELLELKDKVENLRMKTESDPSSENIQIYTELLDTFTNSGGFYFEKEYEAAIKKFGFSNEDKQKKICEFSGGQQTKIAFLRLLLSKPDILLLDEPTNHLDIDAVSWLEEYLKSYKKAFVAVSHDRMFLDNIADTVYEIENGKTAKYSGNYTQYVSRKKELRHQQEKQYAAQQKEIERLENLVDRFRYKASKAAMAQSKIKQIERMEKIEPLDKEDTRTFPTDFVPEDLGVSNVMSVKELTLGYTEPLCKLSLEVRRGDRIGIIGPNGLGKSTFIKTIMGMIPPLSGSFSFSPRVTIGYFDQQLAQTAGSGTLVEDILRTYPNLNNFEARSALGRFMFSGEEAEKTLDMLSGGEKVRLTLCKIFIKRPNLLILDEPTNHMDIIGRESLEDMLSKFPGTIIFVSHDRYFVKKIAESIISFEKDGAKFYKYGYEQYLQSTASTETNLPQRTASTKTGGGKKNYTSPGKGKAKKIRALQKAENKVTCLEEKIAGLKSESELEENISDYVKLSRIQAEIECCQAELESAMEEWEELAEDT